MAIPVIKTSCDHSDVPSQEANSVQEVGRNVESPPERDLYRLG